MRQILINGLGVLAVLPFTSTLPAQTMPAAPAHALTVGEEFVNPLGFHNATPVFSWKLADGVASQSAYRMEGSTDGAPWDSGWVQSDQSVFVPRHRKLFRT